MIFRTMEFGLIPAIFYSDHLEQTIVEVVTIGRITSDISVFEEYGNSITITEKEE